MPAKVKTPETKTVSLSFRARPSALATAKRRAAQEGRSLANYIEWLIERDAGEHDGKRR